MTNREYLNTLSNEDFADCVLKKQAEFELLNCCEPNCDMLDIVVGTRLDFEAWLIEEYRIS